MAKNKVKLKLQGHEKFALREGWINKGLMIIPKNPGVFLQQDAAVVQKGYDYLKGFALETIVTAILFSMVGYFNGHDKTVWVMIQGLVQTLLVRLPLAYFMSIQPDASLTKIGFAAPTATIFGIILNVIFYLWYNKTNRALFDASEK